jgi:hypothetical protein
MVARRATHSARRVFPIQGSTKMSNEFPHPGWFLRPESWPYWMSSTSLGQRSLANDPWELARPVPLSSAAQPNADGGILASLTRRAEPTSEDSSAWSLSATPPGANAGILGPLTQPNRPFAESIPPWLQSVLAFDGNEASPVTTALPVVATGTWLVPPPTPVTLPDWSTFPIPCPPASASLSLPPLGAQHTSDQWLTASYPDLESPLLPMQPIPDFRKSAGPALDISCPAAARKRGRLGTDCFRLGPRAFRDVCLARPSAVGA